MIDTAWPSRDGDDPLGRILLDVIAGHGVDVSGAVADPTRPTGVFFKDPGPDGTSVHYYRRGSAASAMGPDLAVPRARLIHLSGITPALSPSCAVVRRGRRRALLRLASAADIVFVGQDEAERLWAPPPPKTHGRCCLA
jgi:2-dehydro-3-deoxygluconokinase